MLSKLLKEHSLEAFGNNCKPKHFARGFEQLRAQGKRIPPFDKEVLSCGEFHEWAQKNRENIRIVKETMFLPSFSGYDCSILDVSPKGQRGDDAVYASNPEIWNRVPRGCALLQFEKIDDPKLVYMFWAVRANKKFSGHEDDCSEDNSLYHANSNSNAPITEILISQKENGCVVHVSARVIQLPGMKNPVKLLIVGSKKVHIAVELPETLEQLDLILKSRASKPVRVSRSKKPVQENVSAMIDNNEDDEISERESLASDMMRTVFELVIRKVSGFGVGPVEEKTLFDFLAEHYLVLNAEMIDPEGSGPIDNRTLHGINRPTPIFFSLVFNLESDSQTDETLCVEPVLAFAVMKNFGWKCCEHFVIPADRASEIRNLVGSLPGIEGCVFYHMNEIGVVQLEKVKSSGYVIARAVREKCKRIWYSTAKNIGVLDDYEALIRAIQIMNMSFPEISGKLQKILESMSKANPKKYSFVLEEKMILVCLAHPSLNPISKEFRELNGQKISDLPLEFVNACIEAYKFNPESVPGPQSAFVHEISDASTIIADAIIKPPSPAEVLEIIKSQKPSLAKIQLESIWIFRQTPETEQVLRALIAKNIPNFIALVINKQIESVQKTVTTRINQINHVPISPKERIESVINHIQILFIICFVLD